MTPEEKAAKKEAAALKRKERLANVSLVFVGLIDNSHVRPALSARVSLLVCACELLGQRRFAGDSWPGFVD